MHRSLDPIPIQISTYCEACLQAVELSFSWTSAGDPEFGAIWHCPHCSEKQHVEAIGRVVSAMPARPSTTT
jgi:hypothetical protein